MPWAYTGTKKKFDGSIYGGMGGGLYSDVNWVTYLRGVYSEVAYIRGVN